MTLPPHRTYAQFALTWLLLFGSVVSLRADETHDSAALRERGEAIYASSCASCHGDKGQGDPSAYEKALAGDLSVGQLAEVISETMPEEDPEACVAEEADAVAAYIHHAFYSEAAQLRNRPPRVALARLTADQLRQSIADLYARFDGLPYIKPDSEGLTAEYFDEKRRKENLKIERVDSQLNFDFGHDSPGEGIKAEAFVIYWRGGIAATVTGRYEIIVRSTCSFTCDLGNYEREFIDNHVQSGDKTEFRRNIFLTAGRVYPFELEMVQRNRKTEMPPANVSLSWVPPGGVEEIIPSRNLVSDWVPASYPLQTLLPPDDRSYGFERGVAIDREWDDSTTAAALEFAQVATDELWPRYKRRNKDRIENREALKSFLHDLISTAFRSKKLDEESRDLYIDKQIGKEADDIEAIKRSLLLALKSPRFLYPELGEFKSDSERTGARLALVLFDSLPTHELADAISKDRLQSEDQIRDVTRRHVNDLRVRAKTREMLYEWLNVSHFGDLAKKAEDYPGFDREIVSDLRHSLDAMLDEIVWSESSDFRQFFQADWTFGSDRLAEFYGEAWKPSQPGQLSRTAANEQLQFGILTHPYLMSGLSYYDTTSPIHRGVFLVRYILGRTLQPPQEAFTPLSPDLHPDLTTRERVALQTSPESCQVCHTRINGLGFTLENYDAVGRFRAEEKGKAIDSLGSYTTRSDERVEFKGAGELAAFLADSDDSRRAFVARAFQHFVKQAPGAFGADTLDRLTERFSENNCNIRELIVEIAVTATRHSKPDN